MIRRAELTEEDLTNRIANGECEILFLSSYDPRIKATFKLRNTKLYDYALSLLQDDIILGIEEGEIISLEKVVKAQICHFCRSPKLKHKMTKQALCQERSHGHENLLVRLVKEVEGDGLCKNSEISRRYWYEDTKRWMDRRYGYWSGHDATVKPMKTQFTYEYIADLERMCSDCFISRTPRREISIQDLLKFLHQQFWEKDMILNLQKVVIKE